MGEENKSGLRRRPVSLGVNAVPEEVDDGGMVLAFVLLTARRVWVNPKLLQHGQMERSLCL